MRFDIETVERMNKQLNRVCTHAGDTATRKKVKNKWVKQNLMIMVLLFDVKKLVLATLRQAPPSKFYSLIKAPEPAVITRKGK